MRCGLDLDFEKGMRMGIRLWFPVRLNWVEVPVHIVWTRIGMKNLRDDSTRVEGGTGLVLPIQRPGTALEDRGSPSPIVPVCDMFRVNGKWNLPRLLKKKQTLVLISFEIVSVIELIVSHGWL